MRTALTIVLLTLTVQAEIVPLQPHVERYGIEAWLGKLNVPRLDAKATSVYGAEDKDLSGAAFSAWVFSLQEGDAAKVSDAWKRMTADKGWRRKVAGHLVRSWPFGGLGAGDMPRARAHLDAIALFGNDEFHRTFAARRLAYLKGCTKEIPKLPDAALPRARQIRILVEGFRRLGPLWSCTSRVPSIYGEPNSAWALEPFGVDAYPDLVIATGDLRNAGRHFSVGGEGERVTVSYLARTKLLADVGIEEDETVLEAWIQSGTWKTRKETDKWLLAHGTTARTLVSRILGAKEASDRFLRHNSLLVRMAASAVKNDISLLKENSPDQAAQYALGYEEPGFGALMSWCVAIEGHGQSGRTLLKETLKNASPDHRWNILSAIDFANLDEKLKAVCAPWRTRD